jgi:heptosyltransferase III
MQFFRGLEQWGRERALGVFARGMSTREIGARQAGESLSRSPSTRILLIGIYQKMGQFLCATPLIRSLTAAWPQASLNFLGNPMNAAAARANPHLDRVWVWRKSAFWEWAGQVRELRKEHFDLALLLTTARPSATGIFLARAIGARWVAGYVPSGPGTSVQSATSLCHIRIPIGGEKNEVEKFLGLARAFGVPPKGRQPELVPSPADEAASESILSGQHLPAKGPWVGLFIGGKAERSDRLWPVFHFARLADSLQEAGFRVIVLSPPPPVGASSDTFFSEEHLRLEEFRRTLAWTCPVFQEASLGRVAAFLRRLDLLVCPDGGILHLAAAVGTPTLGLFFSTDPEVWRHDLRQAVLDGRGKPSSEMRPETVANEVVRFFGVSACP